MRTAISIFDYDNRWQFYRLFVPFYKLSECARYLFPVCYYIGSTPSASIRQPIIRFYYFHVVIRSVHPLCPGLHFGRSHAKTKPFYQRHFAAAAAFEEKLMPSTIIGSNGYDSSSSLMRKGCVSTVTFLLLILLWETHRRPFCFFGRGEGYVNWTK